MSRHLSTCNISSKSRHAFLSNLANRQTDRQMRANAFTFSFVGGNDVSNTASIRLWVSSIVPILQEFHTCALCSTDSMCLLPSWGGFGWRRDPIEQQQHLRDLPWQWCVELYTCLWMWRSAERHAAAAEPRYPHCPVLLRCAALSAAPDICTQTTR